ncbi:alpha carbonic anhydrase 8-like [Trichoplusia ni]|uniref:Alpha carbonic anhydrase 8-like n=1 Tax=Trichoplusia ni TaxID=7111 RepID=A0A7E5WUZ7_TRINI|nr:alpha carbonic anhydrase 8-like [Trichoplusia ni]
MERLLAENARLSKALEEMQSKIQSVERRTRPASLDDEAMQRVMVSVGTMLDARLAGVMSRLPPEPIMRSPLAADRRRAEAEAASRGPKPGYNQVLKAAPASKIAPKPAPRLAPKPTPKPAPKPAKGRRKRRLAPAPEEAPTPAPAPQEAPVAGTSETVDDGWTTVSNK